MRVVILSKTFVAAPAQRQLEWLARQPGLDLSLITPPEWHTDDGGVMPFAPTFTNGYQIEMLPIARNGRYHTYTYRHLGQALRRLAPDLMHIDEEPYNLATFQALWHAKRRGIPALVVAWQNLLRRYPPPFAWMERWVYAHAAGVIAGNAGAAEVARNKGYRGPLHIFSLHGIDPDLWQPRPPEPPAPDAPFTAGYVGRLVPEKGIDLVLHALARLPARIQLVVIGRGPALRDLQALAGDLGVAERVTWHPYIPALELPQAMRALDAFVLPSRTRPNWAEQFGRVLAEAMAGGVPIIGSASGEIPRVIGDAGMIVPEGDAPALAQAIAMMLAEVYGEIGCARQPPGA